MVSIGKRDHLTRFSYSRVYKWASKHGYSACLLKKPYVSTHTRSPHFTKLMVHRILPGFNKYIIIDDDILMSENAPPMEDVPLGYVGLCMDSVQINTNAEHVKWTANTGFIVCDETALYLLEEAYLNGEYTPKTDKDLIWGPFDQGIVNDVLFRNDRAFKLDWKWNYQCIIEYYINGIGWDKWRTNRFERLFYYIKIWLPIKSKTKTLLRTAYGLHLTMGVYPKFFNKIHK